MIIKNLKLNNFRNYSNVNLLLSEKMNIFIGKNASGKTNILESICVLALTKTYKNGVEPNLISFGKTKAKLKAKVKKDKLIKNLEIDLSSGNKVLKVNNDTITRVGDYISNLNVIIFSPEDLEIIKGAPGIKRNFINIQLSQISKKYLNTYNEYNKILKIRNEYLKLLLTSSLADRNYLNIITEKLIEKSIIIYEERNDYLERINEEISKIYKEITGEDGLKVIYEPNIDGLVFNDEYLREKLEKTYNRNYKKELNYGMTLFGPHRDDFSFFLNDKNLKFFGSQGQQKVAILSFKLAEISIFKEYCSTNPVLLLDDIFSELDIDKRNKLLKFISKDIQSIITTTDVKNIKSKYLKDAFVYEISDGIIERR